ncbi:hypothetical protein HanXRQr2_Chr17g0783961 [Helianthus annuus]|uniref:Uncharacterized protein n=1 Tax=Helianthus annuus TaxID=4232 RepID=A0A9K3DFN9_HELAN|nr:hypothetical protein HanXRQr2_Chr17g0783961 [Helianthus annuus]
MNAGKDNTSRGGGRGSGVGSGLRGGKTKQVSRKRIDCGIVIREPDLSRGDGDAVSGRQRSVGPFFTEDNEPKPCYTNLLASAESQLASKPS